MALSKKIVGAFLGGLVVKNPPANIGDMVQSLVQEDPTRRATTKPMLYKYWACVWHLLKPVRPGARAPRQEKPLD